MASIRIRIMIIFRIGSESGLRKFRIRKIQICLGYRTGPGPGQGPGPGPGKGQGPGHGPGPGTRTRNGT